ncbi:MAG: hypothetical protein QW035_02060 [Candidatus Anstonellales archaeon]
MKSKASKLLEGELAKLRNEFRKSVLLEENPSSKLAKLSGRDIVGKDENGQSVITKHPEDMKMRFFGGMVEIKFKEWEEEKKAVVSIAKGVRMLKHIGENYIKEFKKRDKVLKIAEKINAQLAENGESMGSKEIEAVKRDIDFILENTTLARSLSKQLANEKLEEVYKYLDEMKDGTISIFRKRALIAAACSKIVAFRNRFGNWRDKESSGIMAYNKLREYGLRQVRDVMLKEVLLLFEGKSKAQRYALLSLWERDKKHIDMLKEVEKKIRKEDPSSKEELEQIRDSLKYKGTEEYAKKKVISALYYLSNGNSSMALQRVAEACEIIESTKLWYIVKEIEKTKDSYMKEPIELIKNGLKILMGNRDVYRSSAEFKKAAEKLGN